MKLLYIAMAGVLLALSVVGFVVPAIPFTPFLLGATYFGAKGSPELTNRLKATEFYQKNMEAMVKPGAACLDLGSGSGILSIAALRLGAASAIGVDIDPKAESIARENAAYNGFSAPEFTALTGNVTEDKALMTRLSENHYDIVLVNIVADVIIGLSPVLPHFLDETSAVICSGILDTRLQDVTAALEKAGLEITSVREKEDWRCVTAKRRV